MNIRIRTAERRDVPEMYFLIKELAAYERAPHEVSATVESMLEDGFGSHPFYHALVAEAEGQIIGIAVYYFAYSTWKGKIIYLDDLVVTASHRRFGIGKQLFDELIKKANAAGVNQLRWHVLDWNEPAIAFYRNYNASLDDDWITCKLNKEQLELFASP